MHYSSAIFCKVVRFKMDLNKLVEAFAQTTNAEMSIRQAGEKYLDDVYKIAGFVPALLQVGRLFRVHVSMCRLP
jgi:hypothetical protein